MSVPAVSLVLASRDGARFLPEALRGIAAQSAPPDEILLVDDGSRDGTPALLEAFAREHARARVLSADGLGPAGARDLAIREARGERVAIHDDDDVSHPQRLARQAAYLDAHPATGLVGSAADRIDEAGAVVGSELVPLGEEAIRRRLRRAPPFVHGSVMMRRAAYLEAGGYRALFPVAEDFDLYLRMAERTGLANLPERLYAWRAHPGNTFARRRADHLFFAALARAFAWERARSGSDSAEAWLAAGDRERFLATHPLGPRVALHWGEALVREGRGAEARAALARAGADPVLRTRAAAWRLAALGVGLTPRGRRARAAEGAR